MTMGGEDFSFYQQQVPGCFVFVGSRKAGGPLRPHHHPSFDIDEAALAIGVSFWLELVEGALLVEKK
jgi:amidohydrolase